MSNNNTHISSGIDENPHAISNDEDCPEDDCDGTLFKYKKETVCNNCSVVIESSTTERTCLWEIFFEDRTEHWNSERPRCVGGFPLKYDWIEREDIDHNIKKLDPKEFYL